MARCKLTNMNLRNIRKSREYQCMIIDLVKVGVVTKSAAESLLDYTIPNGLLGETGNSSGSSGSGEGTGGESQGSGSGAESGDDTGDDTGDDIGITVTFVSNNEELTDTVVVEVEPGTTLAELLEMEVAGEEVLPGRTKTVLDKIHDTFTYNPEFSEPDGTVFTQDATVTVSEMSM